MADPPAPRVSVVIATRDRRDRLRATLGHLRELPERLLDDQQLISSTR